MGGVQFSTKLLDNINKLFTVGISVSEVDLITVFKLMKI